MNDPLSHGNPCAVAIVGMGLDQRASKSREVLFIAVTVLACLLEDGHERLQKAVNLNLIVIHRHVIEKRGKSLSRLHWLFTTRIIEGVGVGFRLTFLRIVIIIFIIVTLAVAVVLTTACIASKRRFIFHQRQRQQVFQTIQEVTSMVRDEVPFLARQSADHIGGKR